MDCKDKAYGEIEVCDCILCGSGISLCRIPSDILILEKNPCHMGEVSIYALSLFIHDGSRHQ